MTELDRAIRQLVAASEARYQLEKIRDALGFADLESSRLARHIGRALEAAKTTIRESHRKAVAAERKRRMIKTRIEKTADGTAWNLYVNDTPAVTFESYAVVCAIQAALDRPCEQPRSYSEGAEVADAIRDYLAREDEDDPHYGCVAGGRQCTTTLCVRMPVR